MLAQVQSCAVMGIDGFMVNVEVDNYPGMPRFNMVGLPDAAVRESRERIQSAIRSTNLRSPRGIVVVNLAPAGVRKEGSALDLPIALGMLAASDQIKTDRLNAYAISGELALDGTVRGVSGALSMTMAAREAKLRGILIPACNADEAGVVPDIDVIPVETLQDAVQFIRGQKDIPSHKTDLSSAHEKARSEMRDLSEVKGQEHVKRALTVAAAGGHNILMVGPPGTGKTMLASRLPGILPDMTFQESLETTQIYSVAEGVPEQGSLIFSRPFRSPHHTATTAAVCGGGGGIRPMPGEVSLAHNGVLFLDELPEFNRAALEVLRQPLEEGFVHIRRAQYAVTFPSRFMLVVAMNPCPCGYRTDPRRNCICTHAEVQRYMTRLSGPLLDRIDIHIEAPALSFEKLADNRPAHPTSSEARTWVQTARNRQRERLNGICTCNAAMDPKMVRETCVTTESANGLLEHAIERLGFSARAYDKVLRVARTIADLSQSEIITDNHVMEAIQFRTLDRSAVN